MSDESKTPGGGRIQRHRDPAPFQPPTQQKLFAGEIEAHLLDVLGRSDFVFHEVVSDKVHIDVLQFAPYDWRRFWTFVTSGMSDLPMNVPGGIPNRAELERAELVISLPENWVRMDASGQMDDRELRTPEKWWPLHWLTHLARFPHQYNTWLWAEHSIPNGDPPRPLAPGTKLAGFVLAPPATWPDDSWVMRTQTGQSIGFLAIYPLYPEEMILKLQRGSGALFDLLAASRVNEIVDPSRSNAARR